MEKIFVEQKNDGQRIDKFLAKEFFLYSRGEIIRRIKSGEILVNGKTVKPSYILELEDEISLEDLSAGPEKLQANDEIDLDVIFENEDIIVLNKKPGIQVHPSAAEKKKTLANGLIAKYPEIIDVHDESIDGVFRPGIVHRLDKDTSGVIVVARNMKSFVELKNLFKSREVRKTYKAIAEGIFSEKSGIIDKPVARAAGNNKQVVARKNTKTKIREAITEFRVIGEFGGFSLVEVSPRTGRMHQIRVHLASIGHPIVGEKLYVDKQKNERSTDVKRQLLHAESIEFELFGEHHLFSVKMPQDFEDFRSKIAPGM